MNEIYSVEIATGKTVEANSILRDCNLDLIGHSFYINVMPMPMGSFDVVVGMDWLAANRAEIICKDKCVRLPLPSGDILTIQGETTGTVSGIISCLKAQKCLQKGHVAFLAMVTGQAGKEVQI